MNRRHFFPILLLPLAQSGCMTSRLMGPAKYAEHVSSIYITQDKKSIVFLSSSYHYVFKTNPILLAALDPSMHASIQGEIYGVKVDADAHALLRYKLVVQPNSSEAVKEKAIAAGFFQNPHLGIFNEGAIEGTRYSSGNIAPHATQTQLNRTYYVQVTAERSLGEKIARAPLTPITVATDGALIIGGAVLMPFIWPFIVFDNGK